MNQNYTYIKAYRKVLATGYVVVAVAFGLIIGSSALLADAGHHALSLVFAWFTISTARQQSPQRFTFGLKRSTILVSIFSVLLLFLAAGVIGWGAWQKFFEPVEVAGIEIMIVASAGVVISAVISLPFIKDPEGNQDVKEAFIPVAISGAISLGVVVAGLLIDRTGYDWIDPAASFTILVIIVYQSWKLLISLANRALDAIPKDISFQEVQYVLESLDGVQQVYDLRIWAMGTTEHALSAHLVVRKNYSTELLEIIKKELEDRFKITHTSIQIEIDRNNSTKKNTNGFPNFSKL